MPVCEGYGLTETSPVITFGDAYDWSTRRLGTTGKALHNVQVAFIDPATLQEVGSGEEGEICCSGPNIMTGYRNNPKANAESFIVIGGKKYFRTGDLGRLVDGRCARFFLPYF